MPLASLAVPLSGVVALLGAMSILFGLYTRLGGGLIVLFLVPVTAAMHNFWSVGPEQAQLQQIMFMKNLTMTGGAMIISYFGAGPLSLDAWLKGRRGH